MKTQKLEDEDVSTNLANNGAELLRLTENFERLLVATKLRPAEMTQGLQAWRRFQSAKVHVELARDAFDAACAELVAARAAWDALVAPDAPRKYPEASGYFGEAR